MLRLEHRFRAFLLVSVAAVNLTSQPLAYWSALMLGTSWPAFVAIESIVVLGKTVLYRVLLREPWGRCAVFSLLLNGASASLGLLIF